MTNNLVRRVYEHKSRLADGHTKRYGIDRLVHFEIYETAYQAIQREKNIKHWPRAYKGDLSQKKTPAGAIFMMKSRGHNLMIGIAETSPAMTQRKWRWRE